MSLNTPFRPKRLRKYQERALQISHGISGGGRDGTYDTHLTSRSGMARSRASSDLKPSVRGKGSRTECQQKSSSRRIAVLRMKPEKKAEMYCINTILGTLHISSFLSRTGIHSHHNGLLLHSIHHTIHLPALERIWWSALLRLGFRLEVIS
jgi:hypothetical protein